MLAAAEAGNTKRLISNLGCMRNITPKKETALHMAVGRVGRGHKDIEQLLLRKVALTEAINEFSRTPLHLATQNGRTNTMELLLEKGASIEALNTARGTPLHTATWSGCSGEYVVIV